MAAFTIRTDVLKIWYNKGKSEVKLLKRSGYQKKNNVQSYSPRQTNGNIAIVGNKIKLSILDLVRFSKSGDVEGVS